MSRRTRALFALAAATATATAPTAVAAATAPTAVGAHAAVAQPAPPRARLEGTFQLTGHITVARQVRGEHVGQVVRRTWMFAPLCATGPCARVRLVRARATGTDSLILTRTTPGHYAGSGRFFAPLKCAGKVYPTGEEIPFNITVRITARTVAADGTTVVSAISATYVNQSRLNLTRCVIFLGHDSARYSGAVVPT